MSENSAPHTELVGLFDDSGQPCGSATRAQVRARNLRHGATAICVFNSAGHIYVHRRTLTKDIYPGLRDFCAGGVLGAGETPMHGAKREVFEELGVSGVPLQPIAVRPYSDQHTRFVCFQYTCSYDGPILLQPEEVAAGGWMTVPDLLRAAHEDPADFAPDSIELALDWVSQQHRIARD